MLRTESLFRLAWPIFLQNITHSAVVIVDFLFFAYLGDDVAGTAGALLPVVWMGTFVIPVLAGTGVSVASQYMGAGRYEKVVPAYMMNLLCTAGLGTCYGLLLWWLAADIGRWMGLSPSLNEIGFIYLGTMSGFFVVVGISAAYNAILSSRGMTHWLMYNAFLVGLLNFGLDALFVLVFGWGVRGVVAASIIGTSAAVLVSLWLVHHKLRVHFYLKGAVRDMVGVIRPMMRIGIPNALEPFSYCVQQVVLSAMIISLGVTAMASHSYAGRAQMFQITFCVAIALGGQILMAHWMGARRFDDVDRKYWVAIRLGVIAAAAYAAVLWVFSDEVLSLFTDDPAVKELGGSLLLVAVFLEPARAVNIIGGFSLRTVGDTRFPLIVAIIFIWGILPVIFAIDRIWGLGVVGLWICFAVDEIVRAGINLWRWRTRKWQTMGLTEHNAVDRAGNMGGVPVSSAE